MPTEETGLRDAHAPDLGERLYFADSAAADAIPDTAAVLWLVYHNLAFDSPRGTQVLARYFQYRVNRFCRLERPIGFDFLRVSRCGGVHEDCKWSAPCRGGRFKRSESGALHTTVRPPPLRLS